jgi:hypothetical protein
MKNRSRRIRVISDPPTVEETVANLAAPPPSGNRTCKSSYRKLLAGNVAQGGVLPKIEATLSPKNNHCRQIRREGQVSATMLGKILTKGCNRREKFIADTGTTIPIVPAAIAARNKVKVEELDLDEPGVISASGHDMTIIGEATFYVKFNILKNPKKMRVLICEEEGDEILIDVQSLVDWSILPANFPEPQDPKEKVRLTKTVPKTKLVEIKERKGSERTSIKFKRSQEEQSDIENNNEMHLLKKQLEKEFSDVFKKNLDKDDRIKMDPVKIETIPNAKAIRPHNAYTPIETPIHMQSAANAELSRILKAGQ